MRGDEPVNAGNLGLISRCEQAQAGEAALHCEPRIGTEVVSFSQFGMLCAGEVAQPGPGDGVGWEQGGETQRGARGGVEPGEGGVEDEAELFALREHLCGEVGVALRKRVGHGEAARFQRGEEGARGHVRVQAEVEGDLLDGEGEAAEGADDFAGGGFFGVAGELRLTVAEVGHEAALRVAWRLVVAQEGEGGVFIERIDGEEGEAVLLRAQVEPRGDDDAQPACAHAAGQRGELRGGEEAGLGDVVEQEKGGGGSSARSSAFRRLVWSSGFSRSA